MTADGTAGIGPAALAPVISGFAVRELAKRLASVETLQAFVTKFRERTNPAESAEAPAVAAN